MLEKNQTKRLLLIYGLVLLVLPVGCQDKTDESEVENAASGLSTGETEVSAGATAGGLQIEEAVTLWARGQKDPAAEILLAVDWNQPIGFSPDAKVFILTE